MCGTTGLADDRAELAAAALRIPIVWTPNFSVAVAVLTHLVAEASRLLGTGYDTEIVEVHHAMKRDAPSGTALRLAEVVAHARGQTLEKAMVATRHGDTGPRPEGAIGIQALRGGDNPGEHSVFFWVAASGSSSRTAPRRAITLRPRALRAARWLRGRPPGLYTIEQVLGL